MSDSTARLGLPLLAAGQAQKELWHNEALALVDLAVAPAVRELGVDAPPPEPVPGEAWVVGEAPVGAWAGRAGAIAGWTGGGWRFVAPFEGLSVWIATKGVDARYIGGAWVVGELSARRVVVDGKPVLGPRQPAVADPKGGTAVDGPAREALAGVLAALRAHGLIDA